MYQNLQSREKLISKSTDEIRRKEFIQRSVIIFYLSSSVKKKRGIMKPKIRERNFVASARKKVLLHFLHNTAHPAWRILPSLFFSIFENVVTFWFFMIFYRRNANSVLNFSCTILLRYWRHSRVLAMPQNLRRNFQLNCTFCCTKSYLQMLADDKIFNLKILKKKWNSFDSNVFNFVAQRWVMNPNEN